MAEVMVVEHIPMHLNLGDPTSILGWATVYRDAEAKTARLDIRMGEEGSKLLEHFVEIAEIKAIGFAGIMRRPLETLCDCPPETGKHARSKCPNRKGDHQDGG